MDPSLYVTLTHGKHDSSKPGEMMVLLVYSAEELIL